jgi:hypothetical protein
LPGATRIKVELAIAEPGYVRGGRPARSHLMAAYSNPADQVSELRGALAKLTTPDGPAD